MDTRYRIRRITSGPPWRVLLAALASLLAAPSVIAEESPKQWFQDGRAVLEAHKKRTPITGRAKNVILFIGDGMGVSTVTAARILEGQQRGEPGEENLLSFERLPWTALVKTYNTNQQVSDSAGTMTAMVTGVKTKAGVLSMDQCVTRGDHRDADKHKLMTILELAERDGRATGVVSTTGVTHATPGACYAHTPERGWESDAELTEAARSAGFPDVARQLIEFPYGDGLEVALGGARRAFLPHDAIDPEYPDRYGRRLDGRNLTAEWLSKKRAAYVWNRAQFNAIDVSETKHLLGLFEPHHMQYDHDRTDDRGGEPSLSEMTAKAIDMLNRNPKGYFLMVEGGRIDHAHHEINAFRALTDTIAFAQAVIVAMEKTDRDETLIIVTADHSHVFTMAGYATRGHAILGKMRTNDHAGEAREADAGDAEGKPYTILSYANGPAGHYHECGRPDLTKTDTTSPDYRQEFIVPLAMETHGGEDVPLYADGPQAHLFHGVIEQNVIFHVMAAAMGLKTSPPSH